MPVDVLGLAEGRQRYGLFTNDTGGILDDLMFANRGDHLFVVVNAACKAADIAHMQRASGGGGRGDPGRPTARCWRCRGRGPRRRWRGWCRAWRRCGSWTWRSWRGAGEIWVSRSGYTGEDGFEISVPDAQAEAFARKRCWRSRRWRRSGLARATACGWRRGCAFTAMTSTRTTRPVEAGLTWAIQKARRAGGARAGGFPGAARILRELAEGPERLRVGLRPEGRAPMREGTVLFAADGTPLGNVTSGGFGPSVEAPDCHGLCARRACRPRHDAAGRGARQAPARHRRATCLSTPQPTNAEDKTMKYTKEHEWLRVEGDLVVVGITEHAADPAGRRGVRRTARGRDDGGQGRRGRA